MLAEPVSLNVMPDSVSSALAALAAGEMTAQTLVDVVLRRIASPESEGARAFLSVDTEGARAAARAADADRQLGRAGPLAGVPVAVKDLFDIAGQVTTAGSRVLADKPPARADAATVACLRQAGAVILGRSHMNEFAYSGMGTNPHFAQPRAPWQRDADGGRGRSPGGSTSGGAVAVADGLAYAALGSDTGGSARIPAAFCAVTGWRPSRGRLSTEGAFSLTESFDTPGLIVRSVGDCRLLDAVLSGDGATDDQIPALATLRLATAGGMPFRELAPEVALATRMAVELLAAAGASIGSLRGFDWAEPAAALLAGQVTAVEGLVTHGDLFSSCDRYDPRVVRRMRAGEAIAATDYVRAQRKIAALRRVYDLCVADLDAVLMPTVAILPPRIAELDDDDVFFARNAAVLRNTLIASILDLPAISLPISRRDCPPVGLMLVGRRNADRRLLAVAQSIETALRAV